MLTHQYTAICEFARLEMGGKWTIIGLFPNGIGTPAIPFPLPVLTFFQALAADAPGQYKFNAKLSQLDTGRVLVNAQGVIQIVQAGPIIVPVPLANIQFQAFGMYTWSLEIEGQADPFLTEFQVAHVPQQMRFMPGPPRP
jgi:hypothetical protein